MSVRPRGRAASGGAWAGAAEVVTTLRIAATIPRVTQPGSLHPSPSPSPLSRAKRAATVSKSSFAP